MKVKWGDGHVRSERSGLVPRVSGEEGKTDRDQQDRHDADARRRQKNAVDAEVVVGKTAHGGGKARWRIASPRR